MHLSNRRLWTALTQINTTPHRVWRLCRTHGTPNQVMNELLILELRNCPDFRFRIKALHFHQICLAEIRKKTERPGNCKYNKKLLSLYVQTKNKSLHDSKRHQKRH